VSIADVTKSDVFPGWQSLQDWHAQRRSSAAGTGGGVQVGYWHRIRQCAGYARLELIRAVAEGRGGNVALR